MAVHSIKATAAAAAAVQGEYSALVAAGAMSFADGLKVSNQGRAVRSS